MGRPDRLVRSVNGRKEEQEGPRNDRGDRTNKREEQTDAKETLKRDLLCRCLWRALLLPRGAESGWRRPFGRRGPWYTPPWDRRAVACCSREGSPRHRHGNREGIDGGWGCCFWEKQKDTVQISKCVIVSHLSGHRRQLRRSFPPCRAFFAPSLACSPDAACATGPTRSCPSFFRGAPFLLFLCMRQEVTRTQDAVPLFCHCSNRTHEAIVLLVTQTSCGASLLFLDDPKGPTDLAFPWYELVDILKGGSIDGSHGTRHQLVQRFLRHVLCYQPGAYNRHQQPLVSLEPRRLAKTSPAPPQRPRKRRAVAGAGAYSTTGRGTLGICRTPLVGQIREALLIGSSRHGATVPRHVHRATPRSPSCRRAAHRVHAQNPSRPGWLLRNTLNTLDNARQRSITRWWEQQ